MVRDCLVRPNKQQNVFVRYLYICIIVFSLVVPLACQSDLETIEEVTRQEEGPIETVFDVELVYSDHGHIRMILTAPQMDRFEEDESVMELPQGLHVVFYDTLKRETSSLTAKYAIHRQDEEIIEARNDVVVINEAGERLNTEELIWNQKEETIHSDKFVKVTTEDEVTYGTGFEADERFDHWRILRPHGTFRVDTDGEPDESTMEEEEEQQEKQELQPQPQP